MLPAGAGKQRTLGIRVTPYVDPQPRHHQLQEWANDDGRDDRHDDLS